MVRVGVRQEGEMDLRGTQGVDEAENRIVIITRDASQSGRILLEIASMTAMV